MKTASPDIPLCRIRHCIRCERAMDNSCSESRRRPHCPRYLPRLEATGGRTAFRNADVLPMLLQIALIVLIALGIAAFLLLNRIGT